MAISPRRPALPVALCSFGLSSLLVCCGDVSPSYAQTSLGSPATTQTELPGVLSWSARRALQGALVQAAEGPRRPRSISLHRQQKNQPYWVVLAQVEPPSTSPAGQASPNVVAPVSPTGQAPSSAGPITASLDVALGFDKQTSVISDPVPQEVRVRRHIRVLNVSAEYPLNRRTTLALGVPLISQSTRYRSNSGSATQRGNGLGDITLTLDRQGRESNRGLQTGVTLGLILPTGRDPFGLTLSQLPTGNGFYQPFVRFSIRKLRVPLQLFASVNIGKGLPRRVNGQRLSLPTSYGAEVGFAYTLGPEFLVSTSVSVNRLTSPFLADENQTVAYLSQALTYNLNEETLVRASIDVGLTDDSTDAFAGVSLRRTF